jgi:IS5 family transposase
MAKQQSFTEIEYANRKRVSRREKFLDEMGGLVPWRELTGLIKPYYYQPRPDKRGRPPKGIEAMLRMYLLQVWFHIADEALEETIYDSYAMRKFMELDFNEDNVPDATTLLNFRHLLEANKLQESIFEKINEILDEQGLMMHGGTIIDATIIEAPSSTKNSAKSRDPEMHQTKKGNEWHFGMKAHIGVDAGSGLVHSVETTAANVSDIEEASKLIREDDDVVNGDAGYTGIENRKEIKEDENLSKKEYRINKRKGEDKKRRNKLMKDAMNHLEYVAQPDWDGKIEYMKSKVRSKVEHIFAIVKGLFGYRKTVYKGLKKNMCRLYMLFASANLLIWAWSKRPVIREAQG